MSRVWTILRNLSPIAWALLLLPIPVLIWGNQLAAGLALALYGAIGIGFAWEFWEQAEFRYQRRIGRSPFPRPQALVSFWGVRCYLADLPGDGCNLWGATWLHDRLIPWAGAFDRIVAVFTRHPGFMLGVLEDYES